MRRRLVGIPVVGVISLVVAAGLRATGEPPAWAYAIPAPPAGAPSSPATPDASLKQVPGSTLSFTRQQIADGFGPADWFPHDHPAMPEIVAHGKRPDARACALCHYPNGRGRQENAGISGLPVSYFIQQMNDFRDGSRKSAEPRKANTNAMIAIAKAMTPDEIRAAAEYFAAIQWTPWIRVVETEAVPKVESRGGIWIPVAGAQREPIGLRIVETPEDAERTEILRDPRSGFIAYVPVGAVRRGEALVKTGGAGKTVACSVCHGIDLEGLGPVPGIAGRSPSYLVRQMFDMQAGARRGEWTKLMVPVVATLTDEDFVNIAAYVSSRMPRAGTAGLHAQTKAPTALTGQVTSAEEGPMEGVLVSAKRAASTITITVVTDHDGRYGFPEARLEPGEYAIRIRAAGYDLDRAATVTIVARTPKIVDLKLQKSRDVAAQLTNAEWLASFPGTGAQKASIRGCTHCHTLERIVRTRYDVERMVSVIERMSTYPQLSFPLKVQKLPAPRIGGGEASADERRAAWRRQAEYLTTLNLSGAPEWTYPLKTLPRPRGRATEVIYTEYDLPQRTRQPHDVIVDSKGLAWYASFGEQILGVLDPGTGTVTEYPVPTLKPNAPAGILGVRFDENENPWLGMQFQGGIAKFDRASETFQTWSLPPGLNGPHVQINQVSPGRLHVDGKVWLQDAGTYTVLRLDVRSGKFDLFEPYTIPRPNVYDVIADSRNNGYFLVLGSEDVGRIDAKTGEIRIFKTPTPRSGPRRGMMDSQDRLWFGENNGDRIGMFDTRTERFQEWQVPTAGAWPYDVMADKDGNVWAGGEYNDRIIRLDPKNGTFVEYLLPRSTNVRRVFVDNRTTPVTFWVGNNHGASIIRLEPLDTHTVE